MSDSAALIREFEALPPSCRAEVLDFVEFIKQKNLKNPQAGEKTEKSAEEIAREAWASLPTIEEVLEDARKKTEERRRTGVDPWEKWRGSKIFGGVDGLAYQRSIRSEWPD